MDISNSKRHGFLSSFLPCRVAMDLFSTCTVHTATDSVLGNTLTYFLHTVHGRKISIAVLSQTSTLGDNCNATIEWKQFLAVSGYDRLLPTRFRNKGEFEHKMNHFLRRGLILPPPAEGFSRNIGTPL
ncbi:unnamed protein product, partial [Cuscuta europaea]